MDVAPERRGRPRVAVSAGVQRLRQNAPVRVQLEIAPVEYHAGAEDGVVEGNLVRCNGAVRDVVLKDAAARQLSKVGMVQRPADQHA